MPPDEPRHGPLQLIIVGFETTESFDGQIARELRDLRGRGLIRVSTRGCCRAATTTS